MYVQKIMSLTTENFFLVRADVMVTLEQRIYRQFVCLSLHGDVQGGSCDYVAGLEAKLLLYIEII